MTIPDSGLRKWRPSRVNCKWLVCRVNYKSGYPRGPAAGGRLVGWTNTWGWGFPSILQRQQEPCLSLQKAFELFPTGDKDVCHEWSKIVTKVTCCSLKYSWEYLPISVWLWKASLHIGPSARTLRRCISLHPWLKFGDLLSCLHSTLLHLSYVLIILNNGCVHAALDSESGPSKTMVS